jgi:tyrosyl-DNA phosphodiesterase-1
MNSQTCNSKGKSSRDAIVVDDDDDDDDVSIRDSAFACDQKVVAAAAAQKPSASRSQAPPSKRFKADIETQTPSETETATTSTKTAPVSSHDKFCMLNPTCPIKLYATQQDEALRKRVSKDHWSYTHCWTLREMLGMTTTTGDVGGDMSNETIDFMVLSTYIIDFDFLLEELPELISIPTILVVYGQKDNSEERWKRHATTTPSNKNGSTSLCSADFVHRDPGAPKQSSSNPLRVQLPWGCHHTKLFLVGFSSGRLRVIVHTSNMRWNDVHLKCQGAYIQDFMMPSASAASAGTRTTQSSRTSSCEFQDTLVSYLDSYHYTQRRQWQQLQGSSSKNQHEPPPCTLVEQIRKYDFSSAKGVLIPSTPGFHKPRQPQVQGYLKVRQVIQKYIPIPVPVPIPEPPATAAASQQPRHTTRSTNPIICQFSSIGSLSEKYLQALWAAWDVSSVHRVDKSKNKKNKHHHLELVYPTVSDILRSVEGVHGGGSVPGRNKNVQKPFLLPLYRKWKSSEEDGANADPLQKGQNVPHIKTYYQIDDNGNANDDSASMKWFVLSSQNLSKGALGVVVLLDV